MANTQAKDNAGSHSRSSGDYEIWETSTPSDESVQHSLLKSEMRDDDCKSASRIDSGTRLRRSLLLCLVAGIAIVVGSLVVFALRRRPRNSSLARPKSKWHSDEFAASGVNLHATSPSKFNDHPHLCGNSSGEARELGCNFHQLTWSWLPPHCPTYADQAFLVADEQPFVFWKDVEGKEIVDADAWEDVLDGELRVFAERREHVTHCIYMFLSIAQILRDGTPYHQKLGEYHHMEHCANMLHQIVRSGVDWADVDTLSGLVSFDQHC